MRTCAQEDIQWGHGLRGMAERGAWLKERGRAGLGGGPSIISHQISEVKVCKTLKNIRIFNFVRKE